MSACVCVEPLILREGEELGIQLQWTVFDGGWEFVGGEQIATVA